MYKVIHSCLFVLLIANFSESNKEEPENQNRISKTIIKTQNGPVQGIIRHSRNPSVEFVSFLGLRYANPAQRFEPAKPLNETWSTPKVANAPGNICIQPIFGGADDCLLINVHVPSSKLEGPSSTSEGLPVMAWVHGGGFTVGEGHTYGPEYFMENEDVILVTINYRMGVMGFITTGEDNTFTANNGLRDLTLALQWVQDNIAAFRGNPRKVIIFGESAGSAAVHYLLLSPLTKGLYSGAIMQSGAFGFWGYAEKPKEEAIRFAKFLNCSNTEDAKEIRNCLEQIPSDKLIMAQQTYAPRWPPNNPIARFLPTAVEPQENAFFPGKLSSFFTFHGEKPIYPNKVPVIIGLNRDEGSTMYTSFILQLEGLLDKLNNEWNTFAPKAVSYDSFFPEDKLAGISEKLRKFYFGNSPVSTDNLVPLIQMFSDSQMLLPIMHAAEDMAKSGMNVYPYIFSYYGGAGGLDKFGVPRIEGYIGHADDLQFLFPHPLFGSPLTNSEDEKFSRSFVKLWTDFAKTGVPGNTWRNENAFVWNAIKVVNGSAKTFELLEINSNLGTLSSQEFQDRLTFWRDTLKEAWDGKRANVKTELR